MADHENMTQTTKDDVVASMQKPAVNYAAWIGPVVTLAGAISYFVYFVQFANLRDFPWVNLPLVAAGVILSLFGLWRAFSNSGYKVLSKTLASFGFLFSLGLGTLFYVYIFSISFQMPGVEGVSQIGSAAPIFSLPNHNNETVQLADFQGKTLVITFYRGYW